MKCVFVGCTPELAQMLSMRGIVATPGGPIPALLPPGAIDAFEPRMDGVPALGEHTQAILAGLGWSEDAINALRREGAI